VADAMRLSVCLSNWISWFKIVGMNLVAWSFWQMSHVSGSDVVMRTNPDVQSQKLGLFHGLADSGM
jgi:hypothetical protein